MAKNKPPKQRNIVALQMILRTGGHAGKHANPAYELKKGYRRKPKHPNKQEP